MALQPGVSTLSLVRVPADLTVNEMNEIAGLAFTGRPTGKLKFRQYNRYLIDLGLAL